MDATTIITAGLCVGSAAILKSSADLLVKDAYYALRSIVTDRYSTVEPAITLLEGDPSSEAFKQAAAAAITASGGGTDAEVLQRAQQLLSLIEEKTPDAASGINISLGEISTMASISIEDLAAEGRVTVKIKDAKSKMGGFSIKGIKLTKEDESPK